MVPQMLRLRVALVALVEIKINLSLGHKPYRVISLNRNCLCKFRLSDAPKKTVKLMHFHLMHLDSAESERICMRIVIDSRRTWRIRNYGCE